MVKHYRDYRWENGKPVGISAFPELVQGVVSYKIVADPYYKWISIEKYIGTEWNGVVYDSKLFDFRVLKQGNQTAWSRTPLTTENRSLIRDENDRVICIEEYFFREGRCILCNVYSTHGILLSIQKILYTDFGDPFNGVALFDREGHSVMNKSYELDPETEEFGELKQEQWS